MPNTIDVKDAAGSTVTVPTLTPTETSVAAAAAALGATNGAAVVTDVDGTIQRYLRGIVKLLITGGTIVLGAGSAAIGKLAANSGVTIGAVEIAASQTLATVTAVSAVTAITNALPVGTNTIGGTLDAGPAWTTVFGIAGVAFTSADQSASAAAVTSAPTSGQKLVVTDLVVSADTDMVATFTCETSGVVVLRLDLTAKSPVQVTPRGKLKLATADKKLMLQTSAAGNVRVTAFYNSEA